MRNCKKHPFCRLLYATSGRIQLSGVYRVKLGRREGQTIWIVDGDRVVRDLYPAFIMGGNDQRYRFNPEDDVWIDNRIGIEELEYTIQHELIERKLMRERGWTYDRAHGEGLALEKRLRERDEKRARRHEKKSSLLRGVYRLYVKRVKGVSIWIVDGPRVRQHLDGDFTFAGHGYKYSFIPKDEIWLDSAMSVEQAHYALIHELNERRMMAAGTDYDYAYPSALALELDERARQTKRARKHEKSLPKVSLGVRERGVKVKR